MMSMSFESPYTLTVPLMLRFRMDYLVETTQEYHTMVVEAGPSPELLPMEEIAEQVRQDLEVRYQSPITVVLLGRGG